ncbi:MAG: exo-alpha-sialidase, partial [Candidatus Rokubacteria bacterium]|nr:exo-alpha-sialidase [Candidatus Rokubacteria bacterium]
TDDWGRTWTEPAEANVKFPADSGLAPKQIWQIQPGRADEPDTLYCGVEPAALFRSGDGGQTWTPVRGLLDHPHRPRWTTGGGGLCLHTIVADPVTSARLWVAISTAGVYRTDDAGRTWTARNAGIRAEFLPDKKVVQHPARPATLFVQNHWGLYRSDDAGDSWRDVARGVPSDFGFPMAVHPHEPDTVYILPLESDAFRCPPGGKLRVYRTRNGGKSWHPLTRGLPQQGAYDTVLRDALATDTLEPAGVYFGTRNGKLFASRDGGDSWRLAVEGLPPIVCVRAVVTEGARRPARR